MDAWDSSILLSDVYHTCVPHLYFVHDASHRYSMISGSVGVVDCTSAVSVSPRGEYAARLDMVWRVGRNPPSVLGDIHLIHEERNIQAKFDRFT